jgi:hypothetical protein
MCASPLGADATARHRVDVSETTTPSRALPGHEPEAVKVPSTTTATSVPQGVPPGSGTGRRRRWIGAAVAAFVLVVAVIAVVATRGDDSDQTATPGGSTTELSSTTEAPTTTEAPAVTAAPAPTPAPAPSPGAAGGATFEDGRHAVRITYVDVSGRTVQFDVIQFLTDDEATAAYREDHPGGPTGSRMTVTTSSTTTRGCAPCRWRMT